MAPFDTTAESNETCDQHARSSSAWSSIGPEKPRRKPRINGSDPLIRLGEAA